MLRVFEAKMADELLGAVADRKSFRADYSGGSVILDAAKLGSEGGEL